MSFPPPLLAPPNKSAPTRSRSLTPPLHSCRILSLPASLLSIDLARKILQLQPDTYVLVVSHENITNNWYPGADRSLLVPNCIFRSNGAAMLLTNKASEAG